MDEDLNNLNIHDELKKETHDSLDNRLAPLNDEMK